MGAQRVAGRVDVPEARLGGRTPGREPTKRNAWMLVAVGVAAALSGVLYLAWRWATPSECTWVGPDAAQWLPGRGAAHDDRHLPPSSRQHSHRSPGGRVHSATAARLRGASAPALGGLRAAGPSASGGRGGVLGVLRGLLRTGPVRRPAPACRSVCRSDRDHVGGAAGQHHRHDGGPARPPVLRRARPVGVHAAHPAAVPTRVGRRTRVAAPVPHPTERRTPVRPAVGGGDRGSGARLGCRRDIAGGDRGQRDRLDACLDPGAVRDHRGRPGGHARAAGCPPGRRRAGRAGVGAPTAAACGWRARRRQPDC